MKVLNSKWAWALIAIAILVATYFFVSGDTKDTGNKGGKGANVTEEEKPVTYTKTYVVGADPVRINIPFGYRLDCQLQDAPIDTRTNLNPEWIDTDAVPPHTNGGKIVTWREFRLNGRFDGKSPVIATFTKRF